MLNVVLYTRSGCHLCEQVEENLMSLQGSIPHRLTKIDIDTDPELKKRLILEIPVVEVGPFRLKTEIGSIELEMTLRAAKDRLEQIEQIDRSGTGIDQLQSKSSSRGDRVSLWISTHYLCVLNIFLLLYFGLPFLAPVFKAAGMERAADAVYTIYKPLCHQWSFRSWFLFGKQAYYPHEAAEIPGVLSFESATGITEENDPSRMQAREFTGKETVGYKVALCQRDEAIWGSMFLFGFIYALTGRRIRKLHWILWIAIGLVPVGLDGFSQLLSQIPGEVLQSILPYRESTPILRTITGALFGWATAWFTIPLMEETMAESRRLLIKKTAVRKTHNS
jgi:uncharacterized membrane protein